MKDSVIKSWKKTAIGAVLAGTMFVSACAGTGGLNTTTVTNDLNSVAAAISGDWQILTADAAPAACAVGKSVYTYGSLLAGLGSLVGFNNVVVNAALAGINAVANGPLCTTLLAGGAVANPMTIIQQIAQTVQAVQAATNGKVSAVAATSDNTNVGGALALSPHGETVAQKMKRYNDKLRFQLYGLKHTNIHYQHD